MVNAVKTAGQDLTLASENTSPECRLDILTMNSHYQLLVSLREPCHKKWLILGHYVDLALWPRKSAIRSTRLVEFAQSPFTRRIRQGSLELYFADEDSDSIGIGAKNAKTDL